MVCKTDQSSVIQNKRTGVLKFLPAQKIDSTKVMQIPHPPKFWHQNLYMFAYMGFECNVNGKSFLILTLNFLLERVEDLFSFLYRITGT